MAEYFSGERYKIRVVIVHFLQNQMQYTSVQTSPTPTERGNLQRRRPGIAEIDKDEVVSPNYRINFEKVIRGFHQPLGLKNNIFIKVVRENFFKAQSRTHSCTSSNSKAIFMGEGLAKPKCYYVKGLQQSLGLKNTILR